MGSSGQRPAQAQSHLFVLGVLVSLPGFRTIPESAGSVVVPFLLLLFLWAKFETGIIIPLLSFSFHKSIPVVDGPS